MHSCSWNAGIQEHKRKRVVLHSINTQHLRQNLACSLWSKLWSQNYLVGFHFYPFMVYLCWVDKALIEVCNDANDTRSLWTAEFQLHSVINMGLTSDYQVCCIFFSFIPFLFFFSGAYRLKMKRYWSPWNLVLMKHSLPLPNILASW